MCCASLLLEAALPQEVERICSVCGDMHACRQRDEGHRLWLSAGSCVVASCAHCGRVHRCKMKEMKGPPPGTPGYGRSGGGGGGGGSRSVPYPSASSDRDAAPFTPTWRELPSLAELESCVCVCVWVTSVSWFFPCATLCKSVGEVSVAAGVRRASAADRRP